jgi:hypothetical protein
VKKYVPLLFVVVFALFIGISNIIWLNLEKQPQPWDQSIHLVASADFTKILNKGSLPDIAGAFLSKENYYPPLVPFLGAFTGMHGMEQKDFTMIMILFQFVLIFSVFFYVSRAFDGVTGAVAAALIASYPAVFTEGHYFMFDMPLTAVTALCLAIMAGTSYFNKRSMTILLGFAAGLAMLVKWSFLLYFAAPLMFYYFEAQKKAGMGAVQKKNLLYGIITFCIVGLPWYLYNIFSLVKNIFFFSFKQGAIEGQVPVFSLPGLSYYIRTMPGEITLVFFALFLAGSVLMVFKSEKRRYLLFFIVPVVIFSLLSNKKGRYIMPALPFAALISAYVVYRIKDSRVKKISAAVIVAAALANYVFAVYPVGFNWPAADRPSSNDWKVERFFSAIEPGKRVTLAIVPDHPFMNTATYSFYSDTLKPNVRITGIYNFPMFDDYFLIKTGDVGPVFNAADTRKKITDTVLANDKLIAADFEKVDDEPLPDGSRGMLYRRKQDIKVNDAGFESGLKKNMDEILKLFLRDAEGFRYTIDRKKGSLKIDAMEFMMKTGLVGDFKHKDNGLRVDDADIVVRDLVINDLALKEGKLDILSIGAVEVKSMNIRRESLEAFVISYAKNVKDVAINFEKGVISFSGKYSGIGFRAGVRLYNPSKENSNVCFDIRELKAGIVPLPAWLFNILLKDYNPILNKANSPVALKFGEITADKGMLTIKGVN